MRLIDADLLIKSLSESHEKAVEWYENARDNEIKARAEGAVSAFIESILRVKGMIEAEPVRHGRWIAEERDSWSGGGAYICSACGYGYSWGGFFEANDFNYCPNCGAKMDGGE